MSEFKYCQGPKCHEHHTKDRIRGTKGDKHYETRKKSRFYYLGGNACDMRCQNDWFAKFGEMAVNHFGRTREPKRTDANSAWHKNYKYNYNNGSNSNYTYYFVNDLLGQRITITQQQYDDKDLVRPS